MKSIFKKIIIAVIQAEAKLILRKYKPKIVAITGSVGKTSAKDAIYTVFSGSYYVRKSQRSYNSEFGVPLTIIGAMSGWNNPFIWLYNIVAGLGVILLKNHYPEWLILEVSVDQPGDMRKITSWLKPDIVVITRFSKVPVHVEFFSSPEELMKEKGYLAKALKPDGCLILNNDDKDVSALQSLSEYHVHTMGSDDYADIYFSEPKITYSRSRERKPSGISFKIHHKGGESVVSLKGVLGFHHIYPMMAAFAAGECADIPAKKIIESFKKHETPPGRMKLLSGIKKSIIIDDTYNASPVALEEALMTLELVDTPGKKIAVLGDMLELGKWSVEAHKEAGKRAGEICDLVATVGIRAGNMAQGALIAGMPESDILQYENSREAGKDLESKISERDVILVKGSQSIRMERVVEEIMAEPDKKNELLVRQEEEWQKR